MKRFFSKKTPTETLRDSIDAQGIETLSSVDQQDLLSERNTALANQTPNASDTDKLFADSTLDTSNESFNKLITGEEFANHSSQSNETSQNIDGGDAIGNISRHATMNNTQQTIGINEETLKTSTNVDTDGSWLEAQKKVADAAIALQQQTLAPNIINVPEGLDEEEEYEEVEDDGRVDAVYVRDALESAVGYTHETNKRDSFFSSSCLISGHSFCHIPGCNCTCHIAIVFRDKIPNVPVYAGYSVFKTVLKAADRDAALASAEEYLTILFSEYEVVVSESEVRTGVRAIDRMTINPEDSSWDEKTFLKAVGQW